MPQTTTDKRNAAVGRRIARSQRTAKQQLAKLDREGHAAKRERARLAAQ